MNQNILDFLGGERICVVAVEMPDGAPHAATVHFAYATDPFTLIFLTSKDYRKTESMLGKESTRASVVVGTDEEVMRTFQMDGTARLLTDADENLKRAYFIKFPEKEAKYADTDVFFCFTPTWWRYSDYKAEGGKKITSSTDA